MHEYKVNILKVVDGDTVDVDIDLGFGVILKNQTFRFFGLNTPETRGTTREAGLISKTFVENLLMNKPIIVQSIKDKKEKYGRFLAKIYVQESNGWINVNDLIIAKGLAEKFMDS